MKCADPLLCYTSNNKRTFRNFSHASPLFKRMAQKVFPCGKCIHCRKKKSYELACRCVLHASLYKTNCFITLTYDEKMSSYNNNFEYTDIQKFKKRLRQHVYPKKIEIFNVHEYGKNGKKHWHLVIFNHDFEDKELYSRKNGIPIYTSKRLEQLWPFGFNTIGDVTEASAMYQAQYMEKDFKHGNYMNEKKSHSKHSGIARNYFLTHFRQILKLGYIPINNTKLPIPRYFQKLAHKHWSHYYEPSNFYDTNDRKKLYTPFKLGEENKEIADLYAEWKELKSLNLLDLEIEWEQFIENHLTEKTKPDFIKTNENILHDLQNKQTQEKF